MYSIFNFLVNYIIQVNDNYNILNFIPDIDKNISLPIRTIITLTFIFLLPSLLLLMSAFTRIIIVLSILRNAIGLQSSPPNQVLLGLALCLTFFVMFPVCSKIYDNSYKPFNDNKINLETAVNQALIPLKDFMINQTRKSDLEMYSNLSNYKLQDNLDDIPMIILVPSFMTSELKTAFQIGFTLFIPFLVIDLVVASILISLGMMMLPPTTTSLPFKLILFVMVDGWHLLLGSLVQSFR